SRRIPAAVNYRLFELTGDPKALDEAIGHERTAVEAWRQLVAAAGDVYTADLMMGVRGAGLCGHWRDELAALEKGLQALERRRGDLRPSGATKPAPRYTVPPADAAGDAPVVTHRPITRAPAGQPLPVTGQVPAPA